MSEKPTLKVAFDEEDKHMYVKAQYIVAYDPEDIKRVGHEQAVALAYLNASKVLVDTARAIMSGKLGIEVVTPDDDPADQIDDLKQSN